MQVPFDTLDVPISYTGPNGEVKTAFADNKSFRIKNSTIVDRAYR